MDIHKALRLVVEKNSSELFVTVGYPPCLKINNQITPISKQPLTRPLAEQAIKALMDSQRFEQFCKTHESNYAVHLDNIGRFRVSAFYQKGEPGMVIRKINTTIPTLPELGLPTHLGDQVLQPRGLILFVGAAGSGKTTSMAALIGHRNRAGTGHIITIEDPIEFIHEHKNCIITQRDVGLDTESFEQGLANALRQAPNVVAIGEIRSAKVMMHAIEFVETGHLCLATLHANNAYQALERVIHFFPQEQRPQLLMDLSLNTQAIIGQQLITSKEQNKVYPAVEVLLNTPRIADLIKQGQIDELREVMGKSREQGMQTFDQSLYDLYESGKITYEKALQHATSSNDLRLMIKLSGKMPPGHEGINIDSLKVSDD
ncbi:PilT/PilU family type 4a pilus ATPase [Endozoicomonas sp. Mp262]|uniref:PilT/PilU family type 4a pilus ATPase n=1 Tax=Endozoicomonas sp. Mp262 TaxID=2919499 RepID=UPI0021D87EFE